MQNYCPNRLSIVYVVENIADRLSIFLQYPPKSSSCSSICLNLNWREANQLAIYKHDRGVELGSTEKQLQLSGQSGTWTRDRFQARPPGHSATLPPFFFPSFSLRNSTDDTKTTVIVNVTDCIQSSRLKQISPMTKSTHLIYRREGVLSGRTLPYLRESTIKNDFPSVLRTLESLFAFFNFF